MYRDRDFSDITRITKAIESAYHQLLLSGDVNKEALQYLKDAERNVQRAIGFSVSSRLKGDPIPVHVPFPPLAQEEK